MITIIALIIVIIGALNWLAVGAFNFNVINWIFGANLYIIPRILYSLVGIAGLWLIYYLIRNWTAICHNRAEHMRDDHRHDDVH
ncbi:MAG TPA: DUF378 domain-containing protein [Eubacteriales bacterium]|jgi:uncharacterized membrane protein YuzA (DUF378 family)|nr:DUF378 domain-containing protein [Eubacteriales bacterium]HRU83867.1 DUF378 domain-containing protein [Eubacteriales bacterium]